MNAWRRRGLPLTVALVATALLLSVATVWADDPPSLTVTSDGVSDGTLRLIVQGPAGITDWSAAADGSPLVAETVSETAEAATIVFAVETSSSMGNGRDERALDVVRRVMLASGAGNTFALVTFGDAASVAQPATLDRGLLLDQLATAQPGFGSALFDGTALAAELASTAEGASTVVLITRGWDFGAKSALSREQALAELQASGATVYVVALGSDVDARMIDGVAALGDGQRHGDSAEDLVAITAGLAEPRMSRYELTVSVEELEPGVHELLLSAKGTLAIATVAFERPAPAAPPAPPITSSAPPSPISEVAPLPVEPSAPVQESTSPAQPLLSQTLLTAVASVLAACLILAGFAGWRGRDRTGHGPRIERRLADPAQSPSLAAVAPMAEEYEPAGPLLEASPAVDGWRRLVPAADSQLVRELRLYTGLGALALTLAYVLLALWTMVPTAFGWQSTVVSSGSMAPTVLAGDVIVARPYDGEQFGPGTVIVFHDPVRSGLLTHRIVATTPDGEFVTKGDSNLEADSTPIHPDQVVGVGTLVVPGVALPVVWIERGDWRRLTIALVVGALLVWCSRWGLFERYNPWTGIGEDESLDLGWAGKRAAIIIAVTALLGASAIAGGHYAPTAAAAWQSLTSNSPNLLTADTLEPPTGLGAAPGSCPVSVLDWTQTVDTYASGYRVLRSTSMGGPYSQIAQVTPRGTAGYGDLAVTGGITYYYVVRSYFQNWISVDTAEVSATPPVAPTVFCVTADATVDEDEGDDNFGTDDRLEVQSQDSGDDKRAFVRFDVSSIPGGSFVSAATLTLCAYDVPSVTRTYNLHRVTAAWGETAITWDNQPAVAASATDSATTPGAPACMTWSVASDVQAWVDGTANNGWRVRDNVEGSSSQRRTRFHSREAFLFPTQQPRLDVTWSMDPPPVITSISPTTGTTAGGTSVVITGTDFTGATAVTFGGTGAGYVVDSDTQITATSPAHAAGTVDVRVTTPDGTSANTAADDYVYTFSGAAVSILDAWTGELNFLLNGMTFDPSAGTNRLVMIAVYGEDTGVIASISSVSLGGTALTIVNATDGEQTVGSGYSNLVWLGYLKDADIPVGTAITVSWVGGATPDGAFGDPVHVQAVTLAGVDQTNPIGDTGGESNTSATSIGATAGVLNVTAGDMVVYATVSGQPNDHTAASGYTERLELDGVSNNMTSVTATKAITFAGTEQPDAAWSTSQRLAIVTAVVKVAGGPPPPAITSLSPTTGSTAGGTSVVITGTNFTGATAVTFGGTAATGYVVDSDTQITATSPAHAAGTVDVQVTTPDGTSANTAADDYTYGDWWNSSYGFRQQVTVSTGANSPFNGYNGYSVQLIIDTSTLVSASKLQSDCDDLRVVFSNGASHVELDRDLYGCNAASTEVWFGLQANIGASSSDDQYFVYYGYGAAVNPPANRSNVYLHYNDWSTNRLSEYAIGRQDDWQGSGTYTGFAWDSVNLRVNFDTANNFTGGLRLSSFGERDVYIEQTVGYTGCYTGNVMQGPLARYSGDGSSSDNYYAFVQADSTGCNPGAYSNSAMQKDSATSIGFCAGSDAAWALDGASHRQGFAIWGVNNTNLKGWLDMTPRKPTEAPNVSCTDASDHENAGDVAWVQAQSAGYFDDFLARRYTEPEPGTALGSEEPAP